MTRYKILTIEEKGGLKVHLKDRGVDYDEFCRLDDLGLDNTAISKLLGPARTTIASWRKIRRQEHATKDISTS